MTFEYPPRVALVACPFCREMFERQEAQSCPVCGISLQAIEKLPPSPTLAHELEDDGVPPAPEQERFAATYAGRGRAALVALGLVGIALFLSPWIKLTMPYIVDFTGFDLARRLGWSWGAGVAWVVLVPTVASRRTIAQLRGARFPASFLAFIPGLTATILALSPPHGGLVPVRYTFGWAFWATIALSAVATAVAACLGGKLSDIRVARGTSAGQTLH